MAEEKKCPCGCGMGYEQGIQEAIDAFGWSRERVLRTYARLEEMAAEA